MGEGVGGGVGVLVGCAGLGVLVGVGCDLDACFSELVEAAAGYLRVGIDDRADDVLDPGVDDGLGAGGGR